MSIGKRPKSQGAYFAIRLRVEADGGSALRRELLKSLLDATVSALQAHRDKTTIEDVSRRLAEMLPVDADQLADMLMDHSYAVLGSVDRLIRKHGTKGFALAPDDHLCVAGELILAPPTASQWRLSGVVEEVEPFA